MCVGQASLWLRPTVKGTRPSIGDARSWPLLDPLRRWGRAPGNVFTSIVPPSSLRFLQLPRPWKQILGCGNYLRSHCLSFHGTLEGPTRLSVFLMTWSGLSSGSYSWRKVLGKLLEPLTSPACCLVTRFGQAGTQAFLFESLGSVTGDLRSPP